MPLDNQRSCALFVCLIAAACAPTADSNGTDREDESAGSDVSTNRSSVLQITQPGNIVDFEGRRWNCLRKAKYVAPVRPPFIEAAVPDALEATDEEPDLLSMDVEALAEAMRPVTIFDGYECIGDADYDLAQKLKEHQFDSRDPKTMGSPGAMAEAQLARNKACCGTDDRSQVIPTALIFSEVGCSASFIHPSVAITAAHCVYTTNTNAWLVVNQSATSTRMPHYRENVTGGTQPYATMSCYRVSVPSAWVNQSSDGANSARPHDYAYIDFSATSSGPCSNPQPAHNWLGTWVATDGELQASNPIKRTGYPQNVNPSGNIDGPGLILQYTPLNGTWGSQVFVNAVPHKYATSGWCGGRKP